MLARGEPSREELMTTATTLSYYDERQPGARYWGSFATLCAGWCLDFFDFYIVGFLVASLGPRWLAQSANGLGKILGPLCLALIAGSDNYVSARATEAAVQPAFLFLAGCGLMLAIGFFFAPETRDRALSLDEAGADDGLQSKKVAAL